MAKVLKVIKLNGKIYAPKDIVDAKGNLIQKTPTHPDFPDAPDTIPDGEMTEKDIKELVALGAIEAPEKYKPAKGQTSQQLADANKAAIEKAKAEEK